MMIPRILLSSLLIMSPALLVPPILGAPAKADNQATEAGRLPGSASPDGKFILVESVDDESRASVHFTTADYKGNLGELPIIAVWDTNAPYQSRVDIVWAADSTRVAIHDSSALHSKLLLFRLAGEKFEAVEVPDLLAAACEHWGLRRERVASSGQRPIRWTADDVTIEVTAKLKGGGQRTAMLLLHAPKDAPATIQAK